MTLIYLFFVCLFGLFALIGVVIYSCMRIDQTIGAERRKRHIQRPNP